MGSSTSAHSRSFPSSSLLSLGLHTGRMKREKCCISASLFSFLCIIHSIFNRPNNYLQAKVTDSHKRVVFHEEPIFPIQAATDRTTKPVILFPLPFPASFAFSLAVLATALCLFSSSFLASAKSQKPIF